MTMRVTGLQTAINGLKKEMEKLSGSSYALVGIHESAGMAEGEPITMATLGAIQHYGNDRIPARPWLDAGVRSANKEIIETIQEGIEDGLTSEQIMNRVGLEAVGAVQQYMTDLDSPPNAASTIRRKGSSNPLIDTGAMRQSVTYTIERKQAKEGME